MEFVVLNSYNTYIDAHIAKGVLETEGIPVWLNDENTITVNPILTNAVGGIKIMVNRDDAQRAWDILEQLRKEQKTIIACPKCGSNNTDLVSTPRKASNWLTAITTYLFSSYAVALDKVHHCFDCSHEFPEEKSTEEV